VSNVVVVLGGRVVIVLVVVVVATHTSDPSQLPPEHGVFGS